MGDVLLDILLNVVRLVFRGLDIYVRGSCGVLGFGRCPWRAEMEGPFGGWDSCVEVGLDALREAGGQTAAGKLPEIYLWEYMRLLSMKDVRDRRHTFFPEWTRESDRKDWRQPVECELGDEPDQNEIL
jgi:hypothetical protein